MIFEIGIYHYTILSAFLFFTGVFGIFLNRTNLIIILMSLELILLSVSINFISALRAKGEGGDTSKFW